MAGKKGLIEIPKRSYEPCKLKPHIQDGKQKSLKARQSEVYPTSGYRICQTDFPQDYDKNIGGVTW